MPGMSNRDRCSRRLKPEILHWLGSSKGEIVGLSYKQVHRQHWPPVGIEPSIFCMAVQHFYLLSYLTKLVSRAFNLLLELACLLIQSGTVIARPN